MPKSIQCHQDWEINLIRDTTKSIVETYLNALRGNMLFKFIGKESIVEDVASNIFTFKSGKQFIGTFQIIDDPSGNKILKIEYEKSGKKAKKLLWDNIFEVLDENLTKSFDQIQSGS